MVVQHNDGTSINILTVNVTTGTVTEYPGTIDSFLDNAAVELYKGNIALPSVDATYIADEAQKAVTAYKNMRNTCISLAEKEGKRGLVVFQMHWVNPSTYVVRAFDAVNGHVYELEQFKEYHQGYEIIDLETGKYVDGDDFLPYIDWDFCRTYNIPVYEELYKLRTPVDSRRYMPKPIAVEGMDRDALPAVELINRYRTVDIMDDVVDLKKMYVLERRMLRYERLKDLKAPKYVRQKELELISRAYKTVTE